MKWYWHVWVWMKIGLRYLGRQQCFCKRCGRDVRHDYSAPEGWWETIEDYIPYGNVLCYDCFGELSEVTVWNLSVPIKETRVATFPSLPEESLTEEEREAMAKIRKKVMDEAYPGLFSHMS